MTPDEAIEQLRGMAMNEYPEDVAAVAVVKTEIERLRVHRDAWQDALYCIREQCSEEATNGSEQAEFARQVCDNIRAKAFELLLDEFGSMEQTGKRVRYVQQEAAAAAAERGE